jgi:hypothetical protein
MVTIKEQFLVAQRLYNIDAPSISPPIQRKEASGFTSYNKLHRRYKQHEDKLAQYINAPKPPEYQDPLD